MRSCASFAAILAVFIAAAPAAAQPSPMTTRATGTFDVKVTPQPPDEFADGAAMGRMTLDKRYHGDLEGTARGQMLTAMAEKKSAAYVAVEKFTGTLHGKSGSFALYHTGLMTRGTPSLTVAIVPDSGSGQLAGIAGTLTIDIASDGTHSYTLQYTITP
jgi:hypothetical protein